MDPGQFPGSPVREIALKNTYRRRERVPKKQTRIGGKPFW
jgi:hypothetical protein